MNYRENIINVYVGTWFAVKARLHIYQMIVNTKNQHVLLSNI